MAIVMGMNPTAVCLKILSAASVKDIQFADVDRSPREKRAESTSRVSLGIGIMDDNGDISSSKLTACYANPSFSIVHSLIFRGQKDHSHLQPPAELEPSMN